MNARNVSLGNAISCDQIIGFNAFVNPALLSKAESVEIGSSYFLMSLDRYVHAISITRNLSSFGGASLSYFESGVSDIQGKDFSNLGLKKIFYISCSHRIGINHFLDHIKQHDVD